MNRIILLAALTFVAGSTYQVNCQNAAPQGEILTLEQAIDIALRNNRSAKNAQLDVHKATDKTAALKTRRLPNFKLTSLFSKPLTTFDTTFEKGVFGTFEGIGPIPAEDTLVESQTNATALVIAQVTQPLTQLRRIGLQIKQQEIGQEIAQTRLRAREQATVNEVKRAYYVIYSIFILDLKLVKWERVEAEPHVEGLEPDTLAAGD